MSHSMFGGAQEKDESRSVELFQICVGNFIRVFGNEVERRLIA